MSLQIFLKLIDLWLPEQKFYLIHWALLLKGSLFLNGKKITEESKKKIIENRKKMGVILQNDYLIPFFTVYQNIELASQIENLKTSFAQRMNEISEWLDLDGIKNEKIMNFRFFRSPRVST